VLLLGVESLMVGSTTGVPMSRGYGGYQTATPASYHTTTSYATTGTTPQLMMSRTTTPKSQSIIMPRVTPPRELSTTPPRELSTTPPRERSTTPPRH
jgi:hypothetical protein